MTAADDFSRSDVIKGKPCPTVQTNVGKNGLPLLVLSYYPTILDSFWLQELSMRILKMNFLNTFSHSIHPLNGRSHLFLYC